MSDELSDVKRALLAVKELRAKLEASERARTEPIAIVGMGCRLPGEASGPEAFWRLLRDGVDTITEVPPDRWDIDAFFDPDPDRPGRMSTRWGGFLREVDRFDAEFFGITPVEAESMDPQQRLLLEVAWEALEDAGEVPGPRAALQAGVFLGLSTIDYAQLQIRTGDPGRIDPYFGTSNSLSAAAGRLSYVLGLQGPSVTIDAACTSSLVTAHLACQSLRARECDLALAGGVNLMLAPEPTIYLSKAHALAPDGRCKAFDAGANGFVRGEGCGILVLKRLSDALANGDRIWALIRSSAVNHNGRTAGMTVPNALAQQAVLRQALRGGGVSASSVGYVEAQGTGTPLGDSIEIEALREVYGPGAPNGDPRCVVGAVKTNVGHLEAAAGVTGLIKATLALHHEAIPPNLHFRSLSPSISLEGTRLALASELLPWPRGQTPRRAAVSAFAMTGTNAHVVLQEAPAPRPAEASAQPAAGPYVLPLSARAPAALRALAAVYGAALAGDAPSTHDVCYTASLRRAHHRHRLAVVGSSRQELRDKLEAFVRGEAAPGLAAGDAPAVGRKIAFVFSGRHAPGLEHARELIAREPVFREAIERCDAALRAQLDVSVRARLEADPPLGPSDPLLPPALFAFQIALAALWRSWGIEPSAVLGHGAGEIAAAHVAGALSLDDAARVVAVSGRLLRQLGGRGAVLDVAASVEQTWAALGALDLPVAIAAEDGPVATTVAGEIEDLERVASAFAARGMVCSAVTPAGPAHTPRVEAMRGELRAALGTLSPRAAALPFCSSVVREAGSRYLDGRRLDADYWWRNLREPVAFGSAVRQLLEDEHQIFLEIGPAQSLAATLDAQPSRGEGRDRARALHSVRGGEDAAVTLAETLGLLYALGCSIEWQRRFVTPGQCVRLPTYPWQRERFWVDLPPVGIGAAASSGRSDGDGRRPAEGTDEPRLDRAMLSGLEPTERRERVRAFLQGEIQRVLRIRPERIEAGSALVELGLDSFMAFRLHKRLEAVVGARLPITLALEYPTIAALADQLLVVLESPPPRALGPAGAAATPDPVASSATAREAPASPSEEGYWLVEKLVPGTGVFDNIASVRIQGPLDVAMLAAGIAAVLQRHAALRTSYAERDGRVIAQVAPPPGAVDLPLIDVSGRPPAEREDALAGALRDFAALRLDIAAGVMLRTALVRVANDDHVLLLSMHHAVVDGASIGIFLNDLAAVYTARSTGSVPALAALAHEYPEFAARQNALVAGPTGARLREYWTRQLAGSPALLALPTDRPRPAVQRFRGGMLHASSPPGLAERLRAEARQHNATPFMVLLAGFGVLLSRYSGQTDVVVGSPMAFHNRAGFEDAVGCFVNLVPLRLRLDGAPSFRETVARARAVALEAYQYMELPFGEIVAALKPQRNASYQPVVQVMIMLAPDFEPVSFGRQPPSVPELLHNGTAKYDLTLNIIDKERGLEIAFEYDSDLFDEGTVARMAQHFWTLLEHALEAPTTPLAALRILPDSERKRLLVDWNGAPAEVPRARLHQLVEAQVDRTPDAVALVCGEHALTYRELDRRANQLAHRLIALGIGPESLVGVCTDRGFEMVVALLGVLKAGGAYVPLDPAYPSERLAFIARDAKLGVVVTSRGLDTPFLAAGVRRLELDATWAMLAEADESRPAARLVGSSVAYAIFTSGSTGRPKGVMVPHDAVVNLLWAMRERPGLRADDTLLAVTSLSFDISALEIFLPIVLGARVLIASRAMAADGSQLRDVLRTGGVTVMQATPSTWRMLLDAGWEGDGIRVLCGGEAMPPALAARLCDRAAEVWNVYGPTEATIWASAQRLRSGDAISLGRPIDNATYYVLGPDVTPVPIGVPGELYIGGTAVARGYLGRPALTAERFIPDPFATVPGARLYKTGDAVRYTAAGALVYLSRLDHQVKLRGFRIELGEIETALEAHPAVRAAAVTLREDVADDPRLTAYVALAAPLPDAAAVLRAAVQTVLPEYMVPATWVVLDALPLTSNGKIDRKALPAPAAVRPSSSRPYVAPRTPLETTLAEIWAHALGVDRVGVQHHLFEDLGGNSLLAGRIAAGIERATGRKVPVALLFQAVTVEALARAIDAAGAGPGEGAAETDDWVEQRRRGLRAGRRRSGEDS